MNEEVSFDKIRYGRLAELDSLRGIAALSVVFTHFKLLWDVRFLSKSVLLFVRLPLKIVANGHESVMLFFLLSGFVLSIPFQCDKAQPYRVFLVRRIFRLYIPYLAALTLAIAGAATWHGHLPVSAWFNTTWSGPVDWNLVLQHVLFLGKYNNTQFNTAFWSLIIEMRISIIFPLLCTLALKLRSQHTLGLAVVTAVISDFLNSRLPGFNEVFMTTHYSAIFIAGIYLARERTTIAALYRAQKRRTKMVGFAICLMCFAFGGSMVSQMFPQSNGPYLPADWPPTIGAMGFIVISLNSLLFRRMLLSRWICFLGRISYSLYLTHATVLFALVHLLYGHIPLMTILPVYLLFSFAISTAFYYTVEQPSMNWGRIVGRRLLRPKAESGSVATTVISE